MVVHDLESSIVVFDHSACPLSVKEFSGGLGMGGVFINYRVVDNPLGAAGIHEGLATRFGKTNVFRDCVSLEEGEEYPAAIRAALAESDVLVSIIGPQWLTLRAPDGTRLLDRDNDWVRRELAMAHEQGI